ncbi:ABC transporter substrate-binding protein [Sphingomonas sp. CCH18-H6]|jgi:phospholipid transport system substrate-binding protein|nr:MULTISPECIES: ABC transporter substrate-binding protein [unclassified Sphingomonas]
MKLAVFSTTIVALTLISPTMVAAQTDAAATVQTLSDTLIATMREGPALGFAGRSARLKPVIERSFDLALATRLSIGPSWTKMSAADQAALTDAIRRMTIAEYARNFARWNGEAIRVDPRVTTRGADALVRTTLTRRDGDPVVLAYRLRQTGGTWRIIDVLFNGSISQLATRRADYARILASGGAPALVRHLDRATANAAR